MEDAFQLSAISEYDYLTKSMTDHTQKNIDDGTFALAEYSALREEVLKRIELQNQILNLTLIIAGTAASVGYQFNSGPYNSPFLPTDCFSSLCQLGAKQSKSQANRCLYQGEDRKSYF